MILVVHPGSGSWFFYPSRIPDPGGKKAQDPGPDPQHWSEDAGIETRTVAILALAVRLSSHSARSLQHLFLDAFIQRTTFYDKVVYFMTLTAPCIREVVLISWQMTAVADTCNQCFGSMKFWGGSGSGSGSADPCLWLVDPDPGSGSGSWIRILLFSSLTFKMPAKN